MRLPAVFPFALILRVLSLPVALTGAQSWWPIWLRPRPIKWFFFVALFVSLSTRADAHRMHAAVSASEALRIGLVAPKLDGQRLSKAWKMSLQFGNDLMLKHAGPVVKGVALWLASTRLGRGQDMSISAHEIKATQPLLQPGDILLETAQGYLADNFIHGFWGHTMIYTGSFSEASQAFASPAVRAYFARQGYLGFADYVQRAMPQAYQAWTRSDRNDGAPMRVIESDGLAGGVLMTSYAQACDSDFCAGLRPRKLSQLDKALALIDALSYLGAPYDFNFDMRNDDAVVCSELVAKAYASSADKHGVDFAVSHLSSGQTMVYPNTVAEHFSQQAHRADRDLDFLFFIQGLPEQGRAQLADAQTLIDSAQW